MIDRICISINNRCNLGCRYCHFHEKGVVAGKRVVAYGDGMNDYYMMKMADEGFLVTKQDSSISRSLKGKDLEGLKLV